MLFILKIKKLWTQWFDNAREIIVHWPITESLGHARKTPDHKLIIT